MQVNSHDNPLSHISNLSSSLKQNSIPSKSNMYSDKFHDSLENSATITYSKENIYIPDSLNNTRLISNKKENSKINLNNQNPISNKILNLKIKLATVNNNSNSNNKNKSNSGSINDQNDKEETKKINYKYISNYPYINELQKIAGMTSRNRKKKNKNIDDKGSGNSKRKVKSNMRKFNEKGKGNIKVDKGKENNKDIKSPSDNSELIILDYKKSKNHPESKPSPKPPLIINYNNIHNTPINNIHNNSSTLNNSSISSITSTSFNENYYWFAAYGKLTSTKNLNKILNFYNKSTNKSKNNLIPIKEKPLIIKNFELIFDNNSKPFIHYCKNGYIFTKLYYLSFSQLNNVFNYINRIEYKFNKDNLNFNNNCGNYSKIEHNNLNFDYNYVICLGYYLNFNIFSFTNLSFDLWKSVDLNKKPPKAYKIHKLVKYLFDIFPNYSIDFFISYFLSDIHSNLSNKIYEKTINKIKYYIQGHANININNNMCIDDNVNDSLEQPSSLQSINIKSFKGTFNSKTKSKGNIANPNININNCVVNSNTNPITNTNTNTINNSNILSYNGNMNNKKYQNIPKLNSNTNFSSGYNSNKNDFTSMSFNNTKQNHFIGSNNNNNKTIIHNYNAVNNSKLNKQKLSKNNALSGLNYSNQSNNTKKQYSSGVINNYNKSKIQKISVTQNNNNKFLTINTNNFNNNFSYLQCNTMNNNSILDKNKKNNTFGYINDKGNSEINNIYVVNRKLKTELDFDYDDDSSINAKGSKNGDKKIFVTPKKKKINKYYS